ncbi:SARP family transcriptional regulator [Rhizocola hellebori]|uniref:SARP family transcriptional regulator n=1 Tax=Rhizocola hellebori TaxID=1392758 RepID=A0A8J3VDP7_9ACTN|nr:AfsR/SARP family transcriptional regulator [Rhizocola hellebori]GIH02652.1 SARP family transcriptional regulator [Rhizocola hellebori]
MDFRLLGPLEAESAGMRIDIRRRQERRILGILLLEAGRVVATGQLVSLLWEQGPPRAARRAVQTYMSRLRADMAAYGIAIQTRGDGYVIDIPLPTTDVHRFETLVRQAEGLTDPRARSAQLDSALNLWRGPLLADVIDERLRERLVPRIEEIRLHAFERRAEADLDCGRAAKVVIDLTDLVERLPTREGLVELLMRALAGAGRQSEALELYRSTRQLLVQEMGIEPSASLEELHRAILRAEFAAAPPESPHRIPIAQLPLAVPGFGGRDDELARLDKALALAQEHPTAVTVLVLSGTAGVGKSTLAIHWAHRIRESFPDGQLFINLRGYDPQASPTAAGEAIRAFLDALGWAQQQVPLGLDAQTARYRSLLSGRRVLVVLDNARDADQVRPLLPGSPGSLVVVTSRDSLSGLAASEGAQLISLDVLTEVDARLLMINRLGQARVDAEPDAVDEIIRRCDGLPLALSLIAAQASRYEAFQLAIIAESLRGLPEERGLDAFVTGDPATDLRAVFSTSYRTLSESAAATFRLLCLHSGPDISEPAAASLAGMSRQAVRPVLAELSRAQLVTERVPGRFGVHDLLRAYALELGQAIDSKDERQQALHRLLDHYLHTAVRAATLINPHRDPIVLSEPCSHGQSEPISDRDEAMAWLRAERVVLLSVVRAAYQMEFDIHCWQLAWALADFLQWSGYWPEWSEAQSAGARAADRLGHAQARGHAHRGLALSLSRLGRHGDAYEHARQAMRSYVEATDDVGQAHTHLSLVPIMERQDRHDIALKHAYQALALYERSGHRVGQARALNAVGWRFAIRHEYAESLQSCEQALALLREAGDQLGQAHTLDSLGYSYRGLGEFSRAVQCYRDASQLHRGLGFRFYEAEALSQLGDTFHAAGDVNAAGEVWVDALHILDDLRHPKADELRQRIAALSTVEVDRRW